MIRVCDLSFRYPGAPTWALQGISFELARGRVALVLGKSGCGKSTLALCLGGLIPNVIRGEYRGRVEMAGLNTAKCRPGELATKVGLVFQDPDSQLSQLTVADEVAFGPENLLVDPREIPRRVRWALEKVGLAGFERRSALRLSGGQKQRLVIAAALATGAQILVLDEPTSNLDGRGTSEVLATLAELRRQGLTMVVIEHRVEEMVELADVVMVMDNGRLVMQGPPRPLLAKRSLFRELGLSYPSTADLYYSVCPGDGPDPPLNLAELRSRLPSGSGGGVEVALSPPQTEGDGEDGLEGAGGAGPCRAAATVPRVGKPVVEVDGVTFGFEDVPVLEDVSFTLEPGTLTVLLGPNGSGKTTLALLVAGLLRPWKGKVRVAGRDPAEVPARELASLVGLVFQNPNQQIVQDTVRSEILLGPRVLGLAEAVEGRLEELLAFLGLAGLPHRHPHTLSLGQKKRLALATALISNPQVIVVDEPTTGQEAFLVRQMVNQLRRLASSGSSILVITHDLGLAAEVADRVLVLAEGRLQYAGSPEGFFCNPHLVEKCAARVPPLVRLVQELGLPLRPTVESVARWYRSHDGESLRGYGSSGRDGWLPGRRQELTHLEVG
ncbi:MAG: ATP-binding cassette domain-containing protein [Clostridia bacterium]|nr:ATP-binding cassette domain-containing protein [Clostridia bacterium]MDH7573786.1 ATP-binding cassette domain-containing protein [Clostridia bacterium]